MRNLKIIELHQIKVETKKDCLLHIEYFPLHQGDIIGVIGPNGAGKSTLVKVMSFLQTPSHGTVFYKGKQKQASTVPLQLRRKFAIVMQQSLLFNKTVYDNVSLGLRFRKSPKKDIEEAVYFWLEKFNILHLAKKNAKTLSGGEAQRVNLARALILSPEVLFLDEPFSALDFPTKAVLLRELKDILQETKTTTVFVSHDLIEIKHLTKNLCVLVDGKMKQFGSTHDVLHSPNRQSTPFLEKWKELYSF
ncbi:ATP-binding cassette domain-containing protein [Alkalihalobacillus sp. LMS39]|uniref:ATP-binding cassette domain-containing protein n=1 Tax=Alkalihalobacillus sp. LMS39 TaxID=2924032 RepID=UPI001FB4CA44|nr:ATP-binding cassette domain-containing protein [Alkalihalobacillus sp. LMS39]UOE92185.1 ATP-binding cassette domain-containing protein [Alkalihalobacillus sp. LMS39]